MEKVELLMPANNLECLRVAINNGADAVYIGGKSFSARAFADNFDNDEIIEAIKFAHIRNAKVYVAINTLLHDDELKEALEFCDFLYLNDVDALIVSDFGLINILRKRYPDLAIHVSTQFNAHNLNQVKLLETLRVQRVILAREVDIKTIEYIKANTSLEIEVFGFGALCVCYSGSCLHSSFIGKRSGNRGSCAQPCRMQYTLSENDKAITNKEYLLSTKDLNTLGQIDRLVNSGIKSIKIEGRMKSKEYVALVTKAYKEALDNYYKTAKNVVNNQAISDIAKVFSRGFTKGYIFNEKNAELTNQFRPSHLGEYLGDVIALKDNKIQIKLKAKLSQKDKVAIIQERYEDVKLYFSKIYVKGKLVPYGFKDETIEVEVNSKVSKNAKIYRLIDNDFVESIDFTNSKKIPIRMKFFANVGECATLIIRDYHNHIITEKSSYIIEKATNCPTLESVISTQLRKTNDFAYSITNLDIISDYQGIIPLKVINELRRNGLTRLDEIRANIYQRDKNNIVINEEHYLTFKGSNDVKLNVKVHTLEQLKEIKDIKGINEIYYDDLASIKEGLRIYPKLIPCLRRIEEKDDGMNFDSNTLLINNYGDLYKYENKKLKLDSYMNVANYKTVAYLLNYNVHSIALSNELSKNQIRNIVNDFNEEYGFIPPLELVVYGHIQTMISKYCFIAKAHGYQGKHCNSCKGNDYELIDRMGIGFKVSTDNDCNVTIYNSKATHLIDHLDEIKALGISALRLDFSFESGYEARCILEEYIKANNGDFYNLELNDVTYGYFLDED